MARDDEVARVHETYSAYVLDQRRARAWASDNPGNRAIREELASIVLPMIVPYLATSGRALDVGCGTGWWLRRLTDAQVSPARLHGVDLIAGRVEAARQQVPGARIENADARQLPFGNDEFAVLTLFTVLSSLMTCVGVRTALSECLRVLEPGGLLIIWEPRVLTPWNRARRQIRSSILRATLGPPSEERTLTLFPPLARRLGHRTESWYPLLARLAPLRTHRLWVHRSPTRSASRSPEVTVAR